MGSSSRDERLPDIRQSFVGAVPVVSIGPSGIGGQYQSFGINPQKSCLRKEKF
jgi:hypothetical protein